MATTMHVSDVAELLSEGRTHFNLSPALLVEHSIWRNEAKLASNGALVGYTNRTGRSPKDKFIVKDETTAHTVAWGAVNAPFEPEKFDALYERVMEHLRGRELFVQDLFCGADPAYRLPVRIVNEYAWHNLFVRQLFLRPDSGRTQTSPAGVHRNCGPGVQGRSSARRRCLGSFYPAELHAPHRADRRNIVRRRDEEVHLQRNELPAAAAQCVPHALLGQRRAQWRERAVLRALGHRQDHALGRSLARPDRRRRARMERRRRLQLRGRMLCQVHQAFEKERAADLERAALRLRAGKRDSRCAHPHPDYNDDSKTENTRAAYPVDFIENAVIPGIGGHPKNVVFLTADAFGVLPPISKLTPEQAMYHFLSGYTAKVAGTEAGVKEPTATFSTCFGSPFLPLPPKTYAEMLGRRLREHNAQCWLVNTGWQGGPYGVGKRMEIPYTRAMVDAAVEGELIREEFEIEPTFGFSIPKACHGVPANVLNPRNAWPDKAAYDKGRRRPAQPLRQELRKLRRPARSQSGRSKGAEIELFLIVD